MCFILARFRHHIMVDCVGFCSGPVLLSYREGLCVFILARLRHHNMMDCVCFYSGFVLLLYRDGLGVFYSGLVSSSRRDGLCMFLFRFGFVIIQRWTMCVLF